MSRQDKATTERNARTLRALVKQEDNKHCADCKKNDARWASWNLGVFVCIRCSGIHRSMGTHISKVKSIDLDVWQPEQMHSVEKWGNRRANIFWEWHLREGHVPADHKMESFIRSKYESRRWVMSDQVPEDPSVLDNLHKGGAPPVREPSPQAPPVPQRPSGTRTNAAANGSRVGGRGGHPLLSTNINRHGALASTSAFASTSAPSKTGPTAVAVDLLDANESFGEMQSSSASTSSTQANVPAVSTKTETAAAPAPAAKPNSGAGLFDLDFKAPSTTASFRAQAGSTKSNQDILALFSNSSSSSSSSSQPLASPLPNQNPTLGGYPFQPTRVGQTVAPPQPTVYQSNDWASAATSPTRQMHNPMNIHSHSHGGSTAQAPSTSTYGGQGQQRQSAGSFSSPSASGAGRLTEGMAGMGMSGFGGVNRAPPPAMDVWGSTEASRPVEPTPAFSAPAPAPVQVPSTTSAYPSYLASGADVWGSSESDSPSQPAQQQTSKPAMADDPFRNIWE